MVNTAFYRQFGRAMYGSGVSLDARKAVAKFSGSIKIGPSLPPHPARTLSRIFSNTLADVEGWSRQYALRLRHASEKSGRANGNLVSALTDRIHHRGGLSSRNLTHDAVGCALRGALCLKTDDWSEKRSKNNFQFYASRLLTRTSKRRILGAALNTCGDSPSDMATMSSQKALQGSRTSTRKMECVRNPFLSFLSGEIC